MPVTPPRRLYVLDTSVLLHDPTALFRFDEHDVAVPTPVLRELDRGKRGVSEEARNARESARLLDRVTQNATPESLGAGLPLADAGAAIGARPSGHLTFLETEARGRQGDDAVLDAALATARARPDAETVLVSKDINLRIQATVSGLRAEDYETDRVLDDVDLLRTGVISVPGDRLHTAADGTIWLTARGSTGINDAVFAADGGFAGRVVGTEGERARLAPLVDYAEGGESAWGVHARNREQSAALNLLMDDAVDFVTLLGPAGTGKTLLALAAGLTQCFDTSRYREIIMTRATVAIGEDIGYLPGTEEEKMTPWMGALMDNLEVLGEPAEAGRWGQQATWELLRSRIRIRSLNFMRGRTFLDRFIIIDEAQNLTPKQMKTLITRAGPGTKMICMGNVAQIDTPYLTATTSGLTYVVDRFRDWPHGGHVTLARGERSRLADYASEHL